MRPIILVIWFILLMLLLTAGVGNAQQQQYTEISGTGKSLYRIAIPALLDGGVAKEAASTIQNVLARDLSLIGLFQILDNKAILANLQQEGLGIEPQSWDSSGAQAVVKARAMLSKGQLAVDFLLYEIAAGGSPVLSRRYSGTTHAARQLAHRFADDIVQHYTNEPGFFTSKIAFSSGRGRSQIYVMDYDGHGPHRVSSTGLLNVLPAWSPKGQLAWTSYLWGNPDLYLAPPSGSRAQRISRHPGLNTGAAFSPGGDRIALTLSKDGNAEIYVINARGDVLRRLTHHHGIDTSPTWSPDGGQIAFVSDRTGSAQIHVVSASGGSPRRLTFQGSYNQEPHWCPRAGSTRIAFTGQDESGGYDIFTVDTQSGTLSRLTQGQGSNQSPSWSPACRMIVFRSSRGGLWVMDAEGNNQQQIHRGQAETPAWSR